MKYCFTKAVLFSLTLVLLALGRTEAACDEVLIPALDRGWYDTNGNTSYDRTYLCGEYNIFVGQLRNWAAFSIPSLTQQVVSASLRVFLGTMSSPTASETFQLRHVTTPTTALQARAYGQPAIYADLGS